MGVWAPTLSEDDPLDRLAKAQVRDLVAKGWLTHDGMWFDEAARVLGIDAANDLNRAAIRAMAPFEVSRLCEALGVEPATLRDAGAVARFVVGRRSPGHPGVGRQSICR